MLGNGKLAVNEIFETVQGEAHWAGTPAIFIRLQGCDVGCPWCDTKHTWAIDWHQEIDPVRLLAKTEDASTFAMMTIEQIVGRFDYSKVRHAVITGGEPCDHDLRELTAALAERQITPQIETSGTREILCDEATWVTVSPKIEMPGGYIVRASAMARADEIKMPVGKPADIDKLIDLLSNLDDDEVRPVWLQPLSTSPKATALCVKAATENGWRISVQIHKYIGVR